MKLTQITRTVLGLCAAAGIAVSFTACGGGDHDHDHDHDHEHGDHDHDHDHAEGDGDKSAAADDNYPLKVCVVSGEPLGSMGEPVLVKHGDVTVKLCCDGCIEDFNAKPAEFAAKLTAK